MTRIGSRYIICSNLVIQYLKKADGSASTENGQDKFHRASPRKTDKQVFSDYLQV